MFGKNGAAIAAVCIVMMLILAVSLIFVKLLGYPQDLIVTMPVSGILGWNIPNITKALERKVTRPIP